MKDVVILAATRTPIGAFQGALKDIPAPKLGAITIQASLEKSRVPKEDVEECLMGQVLTAGVGQAPARQAAIFAGLPKSVRCTTINRVCGSGLKTVMFADQMIRSGDADVVVAGGMENMSRAPYLLERAREGYRLGHAKIIDSMIQDGLWDVYNNIHMGECGELCASERNFSRAEQDRFAKQSYERAIAAIKSGAFKDEIAPVEVVGSKETKLFDQDEEPFKVKLDKLTEARTAFKKDGTITAANASSLSDGASALIITSRDYADKMGIKPIARILGQASFAHEPQWFTTAPVGAMKRLLEKKQLKAQDIDLYEINEAFSVVVLACLKEMGLSEEKVNISGGAVALGHPIGASGARVLTTLIHSLRAKKKRLGVASLCIGGGEASAVLVEAL
jgi:acetyl-CoA C-acetyltransferase